jgi:pentatricopeptide repeat protein
MNSVLGAFSQGVQWERALQLLQHMDRYSLERDIVSCNTALAAFQKETQWAQALWLFNSMPAKAIQADVITYNTLISALERGQQLERAIDQFDSMGKKTKAWPRQMQIDLMPMGPMPDTVTYTSMIKVLSQQHKWQDAHHKFSTQVLSSLQPSITMYAALITALELGQKWQKAIHYLQEALQRHIPDRITLNASIKAAATGSNWESILTCFGQFHEFALQPDSFTFTSVVNGLAKSAEWERAFHMLDETTIRYPPNPQTQLAFQAMMNALKKKNASRQLKLLDQNAPKNLSSIYFPLQQHVTY